MLMDGDHLGRIAYETIRQLGDMDKPVFLDPYIDETTEVALCYTWKVVLTVIQI